MGMIIGRARTVSNHTDLAAQAAPMKRGNCRGQQFKRFHLKGSARIPGKKGPCPCTMEREHRQISSNPYPPTAKMQEPELKKLPEPEPKRYDVKNEVVNEVT